ncbi:copper resistance protein CopC [Mycobacterium sp. KBS0706]|uniref:copper resistance CopC/CopD family protein n=1 Tax=Mycobacterium sp. KBS0706 TaxID=2578109 RepID=UPI00110FA6BB|nr:copper resistance protein CopC [Mycobacterium sp. KBS0706]TSD87823.1 copper resistance protein CopC [Mycobacterium sp. KBS0706]
MPALTRSRYASPTSPAPRRRQWERYAACLLLLLALLSPQAALAHASLVQAEPAENAVLAAAPDGFRLSFSEPVSPLVLRLIRPNGAVVTLGDARLEDATLVIAAPPGLGPGTHVLSWRVVSEDGHPVGGSVVFSIGTPGAGPPQQATDMADRPVQAAIWLARIALYAALFLGIGAMAFRAWVAPLPRGAAHIAATLMLLGLAAAPLSLGLQGLDALGLPLAGLGRPVAWATGWGTSYGATAALAVLALVLGLAALAQRRGAASAATALLALAATGTALAASGHASAAAPQLVTRPAVFLHAVGIALWAGALLPLGLHLRAGGPDATAALRRFSALIPIAILPLAAAGILLAVVQLDHVSALWTTAYGCVFLVKLALLLVLFALAALNRWRLTAPAEAGDGRAVRRLTRSVAVETALVLAIFAAAATWRFTPPPRALAEAEARPAAIHIHTAPAMADLTVTPGRAGPVAASIVVMTGDFGPLDAKEVTLVLSNPGAGIEPIRRKAAKAGDGSWRVDGLIIPVSGRWTARIDVLISDFEIAKLEDAIDIRP